MAFTVDDWKSDFDLLLNTVRTHRRRMENGPIILDKRRGDKYDEGTNMMRGQIWGDTFGPGEPTLVSRELKDHMKTIITFITFKRGRKYSQSKRKGAPERTRITAIAERIDHIDHILTTIDHISQD